MTVNRIFVAFAILVGMAVGGVIVLVPQSRTIALFEGIVHWRRGMAAGIKMKIF